MFLFGKKKEEKKEPVPELGREELLAQAAAMEEKLESVAGYERAGLLNQLGSLYYQAGDLDKAVWYYEESLGISKQLGKAYTDLIQIYNKKRQQAAEKGSHEEVKLYMDKVQNMMQLSKDVIRGKI